ncbi:MAG: protein kinase [Magnetococcales bacterium]|nr:protein kinase [Magnetococcales bacterium]
MGAGRETVASGTTLVGRYVIREAGRHTVWGDSYLALDVGSGLPVVIQTIPELVSQDAHWLADVQRNFLLLNTLDHPHIAKLHALEYDPAQCLHFLVREHTPGVTLQEYRLARPGQRVAVGDAMAICRQIADALDHAHRALLHRDLRPENIILTSAGYIKLWNFDLLPGAAREELLRTAGDAPPESLAVCYKAPEQWADPLAVSPASDLWALAVLFYEMVAGQLPWHGSDPQVWRTHPLLPIKRLGRRRNQVLARALAPDPGQRYPSAHAFVEALEKTWLPRSVVEMRTMAVVTLTSILLVALLVWVILLQVLPKPPTEAASHAEAAAEPVTLTPDLKKSVLLRIESRPTAATVVLDGKRLGVTPFTVGRVAPGAYHLWLEKAGFKPVDMEIDLTQDTIVSMNLDASATPSPPPAAPAPPQAAEADAARGVPEQPAAAAGEPQPPAATDQPLGAQPIPNPAPLARKNLPVVNAENPADEKRSPGLEAPPSTPPTGHAPATPETPAAGNTGGSTITPQQAEQIRTLLQEADKDMQAARLTLPKGKNAAEKYQAIQGMDPQHAGAREGLRHIANQLIVMANEAIKAGYLTQPPGRNACEKLLSAILLDPHHPEIGKSIGKLMARYLPLAKPGQTPQPILALLDSAGAVLPGDPDVVAARRALSLPDLPGQTHSRGDATGSATQVAHTSSPFFLTMPRQPPRRQPLRSA